MKMKALAEAIILQSIEDLWDEAHRRESLEFFKGEGFDMYADIAGLGPAEKSKLLGMIEGYLAGQSAADSEGNIVQPVRVRIGS